MYVYTDILCAYIGKVGSKCIICWHQINCVDEFLLYLRYTTQLQGNTKTNINFPLSVSVQQNKFRIFLNASRPRKCRWQMASKLSKGHWSSFLTAKGLWFRDFYWIKCCLELGIDFSIVLILYCNKSHFNGLLYVR